MLVLTNPGQTAVTVMPSAVIDFDGRNAAADDTLMMVPPCPRSTICVANERLPLSTPRRLHARMLSQLRVATVDRAAESVVIGSSRSVRCARGGRDRQVVDRLLHPAQLRRVEARQVVGADHPHETQRPWHQTPSCSQ